MSVDEPEENPRGEGNWRTWDRPVRYRAFSYSFGQSSAIMKSVADWHDAMRSMIDELCLSMLSSSGSN